MDRQKFLQLYEQGQTTFQVEDLLGIDLSNLELNGIDLRKANLKAANLSNTKLRYSDLRGADLTMATLCNTDITFARLAEANLTGVRHDLGYFEGYKDENYQKDSQSQDQFLIQEFEAIKAELESASCQIENLQNNEIRLLQKAESLEKEVEDLKAELEKKNKILIF
jgi:peptidoglycan hydrolase CwlO-like protein